MTATHYIHIGRNKCASTTLQYFFMNTAESLRREGLDYFVFGEMADAFPNSPGLRTPQDYSAHIAANADRSTLISSEDLLGRLHRTHAEPIISALNGAPRRVIAYIRDYDSWVRSTYMEAVMTGRTALDFDAYLRQADIAISALPKLEFWAKHAGWENMHVRSLDAACLHNGDVLSDCAHAMGLSEHLVQNHRPEPKHVSPHWLCVEMIRFLRASRAQSDWMSFTRDIVYPLRPLIERAIQDTGAQKTPVQYLTPEHSDRLAALYNRDTTALSRRVGAAIPGVAPSISSPRSFLPSIDHVPIEVLQGLLVVADEAFQGADSPARHALGAFRWARPKSRGKPQT